MHIYSLNLIVFTGRTICLSSLKIDFNFGFILLSMILVSLGLFMKKVAVSPQEKIQRIEMPIIYLFAS